MKKLLFLALTTMIFLAGCSSPIITYEYIDPTTSEGILCVRKCDSAKYTCQEAQREAAEEKSARCKETEPNEFMLCQTQATNQYSVCVSTATQDYLICRSTSTNPDLYCAPKKCELKTCDRNRCVFNPSYAACNGSYGYCYTRCGGQIIEHIEK